MNWSGVKRWSRITSTWCSAKARLRAARISAWTGLEKSRPVTSAPVCFVIGVMVKVDMAAPLLARYRRASREVKERGTTQGAMSERMGVISQGIAVGFGGLPNARHDRHRGHAAVGGLRRRDQGGRSYAA